MLLSLSRFDSIFAQRWFRIILSHFFVLKLSHCNFYHLTNVDGKFTVIKYHDEISWRFNSILPNGDVELKLLMCF
jgi:hypothetical protein